MSQLPIENLEELLRALAHERGLRGRMRVIGRSWKLLHQLTPGQREKVALRMGSTWAWKRLEKSFLRDGKMSETEAMVGRIFERMGDADPQELREMAAMVRRGDHEGMKDLMMMTLEEALTEEAAVEEAQQKGEALRGAAYTDDEEVPELEVLEADEIPELEVDLELESPRPPAPPHVARLTPVQPSFEPPPPPLPPPASGEVGERSPQPESQLVSVAAEMNVHQRPLDDESVAAQLHFGPGAADGVERMRILHALQRHPRPGAGLERSARAQPIDSLGGGWASRRALSRMIETRSLDDLDEALDLTSRLTRPGQRIWCLADLIEHWPLDPDEQRRVLDAAPTDASRRRLARRAPHTLSVVERRPG